MELFGSDKCLAPENLSRVFSRYLPEKLLLSPKEISWELPENLKASMTKFVRIISY